MALQYQETLVALGTHGFLALTTSTNFLKTHPPLPAHRFGYAYWHDNAGSQHDRFALCMRHVPRDALLRLHGDQFAQAVPMAFGREEWTFTQICDEYFEAPIRAAHFGDGLVLLLFAGKYKPHLLRVIDVISGVVVTEETADSLCQRFGIEDNPWDDGPSLLSAGSRHADMFLRLRRQIVVLVGNRLELSKFPITWRYDDTRFSARFLFLRNRDTGEMQRFSLDRADEVRSIKTRYGRKGWAGLACPQGADICAVSHENGTVEVIDGEGKLLTAIRPMPQLSREQIRVELSHSGRYLLANFWDKTRVVDIDSGLIAVSDDPEWSYPSSTVFAPFVPEIHYRPTTIVSDKGVITLRRKTLSCVPMESLDWQPAIKPGSRGSGKAKRGAPPLFKKHLDTWRKPALALKPTKSRKPCKTRLYGLPSLPAGVALPRHGGRPMLLLCQIDLAEVAVFPGQHQLPAEGGLLFFIAENEEGEVLEEDFNPLATQVIWVPQLSAGDTLLEEKVPSRKAQPLRLVRDPAELPQIDAVIVKAQLFPDDELEEYREFLDAKFPDGVASGHRFGGYPTVLQNNDLERQAEHASVGDAPEESQQGWRDAARWRLLLQLDSDDEFMWGTDSGMLYFLIHEDDLAKRDFSRVKAFCEGY